MTKRDYPVGYGRPPVSGQFKKGQARRARAKPPDPQDNSFVALIDALFARTIVLKSKDGKPDKITMFAAMVRQQVLLAAKGDKAAVKLLADIYLTKDGADRKGSRFVVEIGEPKR